MRRLLKQKKGSILIMAVFFVVALMTVIPGTMLHMMQSGRETQRYIDRVPLLFTADALQERAVKLLSDFALNNNDFPATDSNYVVTDSDPVLTGGANFPAFLTTWYGSFKGRHNGDNQSPILNTLNLTSITIFESDYHGDSQKRKYKVTADFTQTATNYKMEVAQEIVVYNARFFDFSVFYNEDLEITAGPDFTVQGPIFSNQDIYLMNDRGSTLTLSRSLDFGVNPEEYIMNSVGDIYFYFKRAVGPNYLSGVPGYADAIPSYYNNPPGGPGGLELFTYKLPGTTSFPKLRSPPYYPPFFYYFRNKSSLGYPIDGCVWYCPAASEKNTIRVESSSAGVFSNLTPDRSAMQFNYKDHHSYKDYIYYSPADAYNGQPGAISVSSAFDSFNPGRPLVNPSWFSSSFQTSGILESGVSSKKLPVGDPDHPHGAHALIDPLTETFPPGYPGSAYATGSSTCTGLSADPNCDSNEVRDAKFQWLARQPNGLNLYIVDDANASADFRELVTNPSLAGIIVGASPYLTNGVQVSRYLYDHRLGLTGTVVDIDIGQLINHLADLKGGALDSSNGILIYVHTYPMRQGIFNDDFKPRLVRLVNGSKLPEHGLTVATNGRLWIQGDYNIYDYSKGRNCTETEWNDRDCQVSPAAIFSDSFGVLSNQWSNAWGSGTALGTRDVTQNVMVNTGLGTGYLASQLEPLYNAASCEADITNCLAKVYPTNPSNTTRFGLPTSTGGLAAYSQGWGCPDLTYQNGKDGVSSACPYYEDGAGSGLFYLNPKSDAYQNSLITGNSTTLPSCNPTIESGSPPANSNDCDNIRIPIYADPNSPTLATPNDSAIRPLAGVSFITLHPRSVCYTGQCSTSGTGLICTNGQTPSRECLSWTEQGCGETPCMVCTGGYGPYLCPAPSGPPAVPGPVTSVSSSSISYDSTRGHGPLYLAHHSGGLENLINLQEDWGGQKLQFLGTFSAPWTSAELVVNTPGVPKYWNETYYGAPMRDFRFNDDLRINTPPAAPFIFSVERKKWSTKGN